MRPAILAAFMFACFAVASAQQPLTNQDISRMEKAGMSDQVILAAIGTQSHNFTLSTGDLIALKQAGVSDAVLAAMLKAVAPAPVPSAPPAPPVPPASAIKSITDVRTIFISGNNEAAANARNDLLKIASEHPDNACFRLSGVPKLADATLDISERDTAGGSGGIFGGTNLETTVASGTLTDAAGDLLWSNSKQGIQGVVHTGAGDAVKMLLWSLYVSSGCTVGGLRRSSATMEAEPNVAPDAHPQSITWIRKIYVTGSKKRAMKTAPKYLKRFTCLEPVATPEESQAIVVLDQPSVPEIKAALTGINNTNMLSHMYSVSTLISKDRKNTLWSFDETSTLYKGYKGPTTWWEALNQAVGCGKADTFSFVKKKTWPAPTPQPELPESVKEAIITNSKEAMSSPAAHAAGAQTLTPQEMLTMTQEGQASRCGVYTVPPGAEIDIDGKKAGISPMGFLLLRKGTTPRVVTIKMSGYKTVEKKVVPDGKTISIGLVLEKGSN